MTLTSGTRLGPYEILSAIGAGGMGEVYRAADSRLGREVAVKVVSERLFDDPHALARLQREARTVASLTHPNIVALHDIGNERGVAFVVMELLDGESLDRFAGTTPLPWKQALEIAASVADALAAAHEKGVIHRDLKPANIFMTRDGGLKVLDFGLAKQNPFRPPRHTGATGLSETEPGVALGTVGYMSPEQVKGEPADARSDIFSLGCVLYEMLSGDRAFQGGTSPEILAAILRDHPPPLAAFDSQIRAHVSALVERCLEKDPERRFQSARDLAFSVRQILSTSEPQVAWARPGSGAFRRGIGWAAAVLMVSVGVIGVILSVVSWRRAPPAEDGPILVADFVNRTADEVFDGTLRQGLMVHLAQSPHFSVVPRERVRETLRQMTRSPDDLVVGEIARELCQRTGAKVTVNGSIAQLGHHYVLGLEALDCASGRTVAVEQAEVSKREQVLRTLGSAASKLRRRLGESLASVRSFDTPLERATTPSLEALKAFTIGQDFFMRTGDVKGSIPLVKRAIELDADFALAYARLSALSSGVGQTAEEAHYAREAYARRDRVTELERFYIDSRYCGIRRGPELSSNCLMDVYELWKRTYPREWQPYHGLAALHLTRGNYETALENSLEAIRLNPDQGFAYLSAVDACLGLNRFSDALARHLMEAWMHELRFLLAFAAGDEAAMTRERQAVAGTNVEVYVILDASEIAAFGGHISESRVLRGSAERLAPSGSRLRMNILAGGAVLDAAVGISGRLADPPGPLPAVVRLNLAVAAVLSGDLRRAATMLREDEVPMGSLPLLTAARALLAAQRGEVAAAQQLLAGRSTSLGSGTGFRPAYLRGLAYLKAGDRVQAAAEFQRIIDHRGVDLASPLYPLAYLQHGRASAVIGDVARARSDYETFLSLWKDADADVPVLHQARAEYAALMTARD